MSLGDLIIPTAEESSAGSLPSGPPSRSFSQRAGQSGGRLTQTLVIVRPVLLVRLAVNVLGYQLLEPLLEAFFGTLLMDKCLQKTTYGPQEAGFSSNTAQSHQSSSSEASYSSGSSEIPGASSSTGSSGASSSSSGSSTGSSIGSSTGSASGRGFFLALRRTMSAA